VRILALLLAFAMFPSAMEAVEVAVHLVQHGDFAHGDQDEHASTPLGTDEHGCSGTFHLCSCHHNAASSGTGRVAVMVGTDVTHAITNLAPVSRDGEAAPAPPIRPPIA